MKAEGATIKIRKKEVSISKKRIGGASANDQSIGPQRTQVEEN
jgi:hypothetical protein